MLERLLAVLVSGAYSVDMPCALSVAYNFLAVIN